MKCITVSARLNLQYNTIETFIRYILRGGQGQPSRGGGLCLFLPNRRVKKIQGTKKKHDTGAVD